MPDTHLQNLTASLTTFVEATEHQSQNHIKSLHWHIALRLVVEGGFFPDDITPRPPLRVETVGTGSKRRFHLIHDPSAAIAGEQTILGGLKTKAVDVVVSKKDVGPCLAISVKGTMNAFRNLTNRMEEAAGDCTNLHISYPALVYGFLHVMKANFEGNVEKRNDIAVYASGEVAEEIRRYHDAMVGLSGRLLMRDDVSRYEAVAIALINTDAPQRGELISSYPPPASPLAFERFFRKLYDIYDLRFVYAAPALRAKTLRCEWTADPATLDVAQAAGLNPRVTYDHR